MSVSNRAIRRQLERDNATRPATLRQMPRYQWPGHLQDPTRIEVWLSRKYLVQVFDEGNSVLRASVCRTVVTTSLEWADRLTWDELQSIKRQIGRGDLYAVEVYPRDRDIVNVANMRHLWIFPEPLQIGWFRN